MTRCWMSCLIVSDDCVARNVPQIGAEILLVDEQLDQLARVRALLLLVEFRATSSGEYQLTT